MVLTRRTSRYFDYIPINTDLLDLPLSVVDKIVYYLDDISLMRFKKVCKFLYDHVPVVKFRFKFPVAVQKSGQFPRKVYMRVCCDYYYTSRRCKHEKILECIICDSKHFPTYKCPNNKNTYVITCVNCNLFRCIQCDKELFFSYPRVCDSCEFNTECNIPNFREVKILTDNYEIKYCKGNRFRVLSSKNPSISEGELRIVIGKYEIKYRKDDDHELINILFQNFV
jgi:hypothetical protein